MKFLPDPGNIRKCIVKSLEKSSSLDAAVAFVGRDWGDIIGTFSGRIRVVCWLSSPNTNPYAVEQMMKRKNILVRQLPAMHAKVYILKGQSPRCVVGSANLTGAALSEENASGQYEAAVEISDRRRVKTVERWFRGLWKDTRSISQDDLASAKDVWNKARRRRGGLGKTTGGPRPSGSAASLLSVDWEPQGQLVDLADKVRRMDFAEFDKYKSVLVRIVRRGREVDVNQLIKFVAAWTGHEGIYQPALEEPAKQVRKAFRTLFDHSRNVDGRLRDLDTDGSSKINGFGLASLTMILYWRFPREYPPFNRRTKRFLEDFELQELVPKTLSPAQYAKWIAFCQDLSGRLGLPSSGHIDRLVWEYTRDLDVE